MYITAEDILPLGDGFIYTVQLVNNDNYKYIDNKYLANGTTDVNNQQRLVQ